MSLEYIETNEEGLPLIEKPWVKLNKLHSTLSPFFSAEYESKTFIDRKNELLEKAKRGTLKIFIARDACTGEFAGYCVCTVNGTVGELDSIFVEEAYRKHDIGNEFMRRSDIFFRSESVKKQILSVFAGNEGVMRFYNKHNYYQKYIILEKKETAK
jgi:GNAT superfamily N-acetyltransferase